LRNKGTLEKDEQVRIGFTNRIWTTVGHVVSFFFYVLFFSDFIFIIMIIIF